MKKIFILSLLGIGLFESGIVFAGNIELKATRNVCKLEVREGSDAITPTNNPIVYSGSVNSGWVYVGNEGSHLWWKRGGHWDDCVPAGWTSWKGAHNSISGTDHVTID